MLQFIIIKIFIISITSFLIAFFCAPLLTHFLYKYKLGKKIRDEQSAPIFSKLHKTKSGTPTMGGLLIWITVFFLALFFFYLYKITNLAVFRDFNFFDRRETWLPLGALVASALVGLFDDYLNVRGIGPKGGGLKMTQRILMYTLIAIVGAWWFFYKLDWDLLHIPFLGDFNIGWWYIPFFILVIVATAFSVNETDGLDGLAGGTLLIAFMAFGAMAFLQGKFDLATFCGAIVGALVAFLWFNIYPARFFMGDTGAMALGVTLGIIAILTNTALLLPIIGFLFVIESSSVIVQVLSKKIRHKKIFLSSPIHHHLQAIGWPEPKIVMRFWLIAGISAVIGLILFLVDRML